MTREKDYLVQTLFERENLEEMTLDELKGLSEQYPFSSVIQFLYTCKLKTLYHLDFPEAVTKTALFFNDPYWLDYQLSDDQGTGSFRWEQYQVEEVEEVEGVEGVEEVEEVEEVEVDLKIPIEPYHTIDYFASQGIKLTSEEEKDEFAKKVKSFTAWLKTMKRLQPEPENISIKDPSLFAESKESFNAVAEEVVTEAMAEVYLKQGMKEKAIEVYNKLSLQNPANSHIFAARIITIKEQ
ncbi:MAG: hypothetical protein ACK4YD_01885 [Chitinophagia bacterium]|jgi:hypothetical protein